MAIKTFFRPEFGQIEIRNAATPVLSVELVTDGQTYAVYRGAQLEDPMVGSIRKGTNDVLAPFPLSKAISVSKVECKVAMEGGIETVGVRIGNQLTLLSQLSAGASASTAREAPDSDVKAKIADLPWNERLNLKLAEFETVGQWTAESLGLTNIDWPTETFMLSNGDFASFLFKLVLGRDDMGEGREYYIDLQEKGISRFDIVRRMVSSNEAMTQDLEPLRDTDVVRELVRAFVKAKISNEAYQES